MSSLKADLINFKQVVLLDYKNLNLDFLCSKVGSTELIFYIPCYIMSESHQDNIRILKKTESEELIKLYHLYEFSDKFRLLSNNENYGGIINLLNTGVLTEDEMYEALFVL